MNKKSVIILGSSGHAKVIIDIFEKSGEYEIIGLLDPNRLIGEETLGYQILGSENDLPNLLKKHPDSKLFIAIADNSIREKIAQQIYSKLPNVDFANAIHPSAQIAKNVTIGKGVAIMAGAIVNSDCQIGNFTIVNTKASLDHDGIMMDYSSLAPNATVGGNVCLGVKATIAIGATVIQGIKIGQNSLIGAGSLLLKNCDDNTVMYGIPAIPVRKK